MSDFKPDTEITPVLFRANRSGPFKGDVTAVFPCENADLAGYAMTCYQHVGQHGACYLGWYHTTRRATQDEYAALQRELESAPYGYRFKVYARIQPWMHKARFAEAKRLRDLRA
jgi:hypothetical protein